MDVRHSTSCRFVPPLCPSLLPQVPSPVIFLPLATFFLTFSLKSPLFPLCNDFLSRPMLSLALGRLSNHECSLSSKFVPTSPSWPPLLFCSMSDSVILPSPSSFFIFPTLSSMRSSTSCKLTLRAEERSEWEGLAYCVNKRSRSQLLIRRSSHLGVMCVVPLCRFKSPSPQALAHPVEFPPPSPSLLLARRQPRRYNSVNLNVLELLEFTPELVA